MSIRDIGDNVRRHMKIQNLTIPKLSAKMGMGTAGLSNILNGKAEPKSSTLIKLSETLDVPISELLADAPRLRSIRFRTVKTLSGREKAARDQLRHDTAVWLSDYQVLEMVLKEKISLRLSKIQDPNPIVAASKTRHELGIQPDAPIYDFPSLIEKAGIKLRIRPFGFRKTFGLSVGPEDGGPAIVVNSESGISIERQIFTVAHELGHLLLHRASYDDAGEFENEVEEAEANKFAGCFLVPDEGLRREWEDSKGLHWVDAVLRVKKVYKVSYKTILMRLKQINSSLSNRPLEREFAIAYKELHGHDLRDHYEPDATQGPVASVDPDSLGKNDFVEDQFSRLVREAYEKEFISISRAGEMLNRSLEAMRALVFAWQAV